MKNKELVKIIIYVVSYMLMGIFIPIILKLTIFENLALSNLSNNEWASFLGSYVGGILGGLGTLISMYITVKNSLSTQEKNKKETDQRIEEEYKRHQAEIAAENHRRDIERNSDKKENNKRDRQQFVNGIAKELGTYITHISNYYFASLEAWDLQEKFTKAKTDLSQIEQKLKIIDEKLTIVSVVDSTELTRLRTERDKIIDEKDRLNRIYNEVLREKRSNSQFGNRLIANESFFTLKALLSNINTADNLLKKLEEIHKDVVSRYHEEEYYAQWIDTETKKLIQEFTVFMNNYVENVEN